MSTQTAMIKACNTSNSVRNTGKECDTAMKATAMLFAIDPSVTWTDQDLLDPVEWMMDLIHQRKAFPIFGQKAPIRYIANAGGDDVTVTMDDGTISFIRYGVYNRTFSTTAGGLCYAQALQSFNSSGYRLMEIDITGQAMFRTNADGTYAGFITDFMYAPAPGIADLKSTLYLNKFSVSYNPQEVVNNGTIFKNASPLLSMMGLIDTEISDAGSSSITKLKIKVKTECAGTDLILLFGSSLAVAGNFIVTDDATKATVSITAAAIVGDHIELTGTFVSGHKYDVIGAAPTVWRAAQVEGYDGTYKGAIITIP